jgi:putative ABC transport system ATP-binding protein
MITLTEVTKSYPGGVHALRGASLHVAAGEFVGIVGPSGSGKSTLLHLMGTLDRPSAGSVEILGHDVAGLRDGQLAAIRAHWIGFVFQQFFLSGMLSALENVASGLLYLGPSRRERLRRAARALERVGLDHRARHRPQEMSGGERQRVAVARALVSEPAVLLADEPTGNLDSASGRVVMELLDGLNRDGTTVVVITHNTEVAEQLPRQLHVRDGRVVRDTGRAGENAW